MELTDFKTIKNSTGKTICRADARHRIVEIVQKGIRTTIRFCDDGGIKVENSKIVS